MKTECGQTMRRTVTFWSRSKDSAMDPPLPSEAVQTQPAPPSPLASYRWHTGGGGEKAAGGFHWGRFAGWGRTLSHQEPMVSSQPAPRSLFRRVLSAPPKVSRSNRLRLTKTLWGRHKNVAPPEATSNPKAPEPELELETTPDPVAQIPEPPTPDMPVWDIGGFTLLEGRLVLLGEEEGPRQMRMGSASSESSMQASMGNLRDPDRTAGKTEPEATGSNQVHNVRGLLKRLKEKKRVRSELGAHGPRDGPPSALGSRESLATLSELDLGAEKNVRVWPLHSSLLGEPYCFQVTWTGGSRCFYCRSSAERDRWIEDLRRQFQPSQDNVERQETWLTIWVHEAKGLPRAAAPGVRAELWLDGALLARTAPRAGPGQLFWAERFHFEALPPARRLSLRLRGAGPAGAAVGRVALELDEASIPRAPAAGLERWFPVLGVPAGAALRARIRVRRLRVLPSERYKELAEFLTFHYARLCEALESALSAQAKEELAAAMVRVLRATGRAQALVTDLGTAELARCGGREALLFRENTLATKAIDEYMKLVAQEYLQETLGEVVQRLCASTEDCEVDPSKCRPPELSKHQARLRNSCEEVFEAIINSYNWFPAELGTVFSSWREACQARGSEALGPRLVCASLFLRLLCPAILAPSLFGLAPEHPAPGPARTLTLIAKVIQNLANRAPFGEKEAYMAFMNSFLEDHGPAMQHFLDQVAVVDANATPSGYQGSGDLALQLAVLHVQLCTIFAELDQTTQDSLEPLPTILRAIEEGRPVPVSVPMRLPQIPTKVHSSFSSGEKPGFLPPRDLPKHTPLISKSQSLRSFQGAGSWAHRRPDEERSQQRPRQVQRTQSVPARRPARRRPSAGPRPRLKESLGTGPVPCGRAWTGASASLPRKPSVPWQRQLDQPGDRYQALGTHRPVGKLAELQCEVAALREEQKALSRLVESLSTHIQALTEQQEQLRCQLQDLDSRLGAGISKLDSESSLPSNGSHRLKSLEHRLTEMECTQNQLRDTLHSLQLLSRTPGSRSQPLPLKTPCVNGAELSTGT
ncbi:RAS protein activator like-3 isoform X1 [Arvicola amphibius]|uniref:RAS protein activator like-3 isoform X1 n=2 Tax=Arvicola amphibius TaxID=1047088 RepID=UPI0018E3C9BC|nr:RAS protein activator like-3 isoform X1 [Arvicola amphibius]XP_038174744.1 RAS protein activator like-3 isoform X1 [Arvicola amphibius]